MTGVFRGRSVSTNVRLAMGLALMLAFLGPPGASATGEVIALSGARIPERTVADHPFEAHVTLTNKGDAPRTIYLFAALYTPGSTPCGPATDPRFRAFTPLLQARVEVPAGGKVEYPAPGERWLQRYHAKDVPVGNATMELCIFAAEDGTAGSAQLRYDDFVSLPLATRDANHAPTADFSWSADNLFAARDIDLHATGADAEGDPIVYSWDFGHANASGRKPALGANVVHAFYPDGAYEVTLTASDGFDESRVTHVLDIAPEPNSDTIGLPHKNKTPFVGPLTWAAAAAVVALSLRGRPR